MPSRKETAFACIVLAVAIDLCIKACCTWKKCHASLPWISFIVVIICECRAMYLLTLTLMQYCKYGSPRCCVRGCPITKSLKSLKFPQTEDIKLVCQFHERDVMNCTYVRDRRQRPVVSEMHDVRSIDHEDTAESAPSLAVRYREARLKPADIRDTSI